LTEELHKAFEDKSKLESDCEQLMRNEQTPNRILKLTENEVERLRKRIKLLLNETVALSEEQVKTFEAVTQLGEEEDHLTSNILEEANQKVCEIFGSSGISLDKKP
jgi:exoribonuclease R